MPLLRDVTDETRLLQALIEKTLIKTEEVQCGGDTGGDPAAAARNLLDFHLATLELKRLAADLHRIAEDLFTANIGGGRSTIDGTTVDVRRAYRRNNWEHAKLATHVALWATGGELLEGMDRVVDAFIQACLPGWRVTALKEMGIDADEEIEVDDETGQATGVGKYCSRELGRATVTIL